MEAKYDPSKIRDFELAMISIEINCCHNRLELLNELLNKVGEAKGYSDAGKTPSQSTMHESKQTESTFDKLPWKSYQTKHTAKPDEAGWIFSNNSDAEEL